MSRLRSQLDHMDREDAGIFDWMSWTRSSRSNTKKLEVVARQVRVSILSTSTRNDKMEVLRRDSMSDNEPQWVDCQSKGPWVRHLGWELHLTNLYISIDGDPGTHMSCNEHNVHEPLGLLPGEDAIAAKRKALHMVRERLKKNLDEVDAALAAMCWEG